MGNACSCLVDGTSSSSEPTTLHRHRRKSLSESVKEINTLNTAAATLGATENTLQSKVDELETQKNQENDPEKKRKIQDRLQREQTKLNRVKGQKERAEDMSYQKILKKSQRVLQDVEGEVGAANVLNKVIE
ncbi:uncharacterized protein LOC135351850 [Halichondria panicea]|uniref:uncharacterized protein LOC135351850 n=1 Tax=Halichondria panicea TaxID=6063 RepID=UPI00312B433C